jgi:hypothetical protein
MIHPDVESRLHASPRRRGRCAMLAATAIALCVAPVALAAQSLAPAGVTHEASIAGSPPAPTTPANERVEAAVVGLAIGATIGALGTYVFIHSIGPTDHQGRTYAWLVPMTAIATAIFAAAIAPARGEH